MKSLIFGFLGTSVLVVLILAPFASSAPDGLEHALERLGLTDLGSTQPAPLPDYAVPGVTSEAASTSLAGLIGLALVFSLATGLSLWLREPPLPTAPPAEGSPQPREDTLV